MLPVPEFVKLIATDPLLPTGRLPKLTLEGFAVSCPWVPVPLNAMVTVGFVALLSITIEPTTLPVALGLNFALNDVLCPALSVVVLRLLILNPAPAGVAFEIEMLVVPVFERVMVCELVLPTATLPNATLPGLTIRVAFEGTPLPARSSVCGEFVALSTNLMLPVIPCGAPGVNCAVNDTLLPRGSWQAMTGRSFQIRSR